jgi:hypothetical protein
MTVEAGPTIASHAMAEATRMRDEGRRDALIAVLIAVIAFVGYCAWWPDAPIDNPDMPSYMRVAADLKEMKWTRFHQRTPGYPLIILLTGSEKHLTRTLFHTMLAAQLIAALVMALLLVRLCISRKLAFASFVIALLPPYVAPSAYAATESVCSLFIVIAFASLVLWIRDGRPVLLAQFAIAAAYAAFVRPTYQLLVPTTAVAVLAAYWAGWTGRLRLRNFVLSMAIAATTTLSGLGACAYVNYLHFGQWDSSSMTARALSSKVATVLEFLPDEYSDLRAVLVKHRDSLITAPYSDHTGQDYIYRAMPDLLRMYNDDDVRALCAVKEASLYLIRKKPFTFVHESMKLFASFWMPVDYDLPGLKRGLGRAASSIFQLLLNAAFLVLALVMLGLMLFYASVRASARRLACWPLQKQDQALACCFAIALSVVLYTMVVSCFMGTGLNRYRTCTEPLILSSLAIGVTLWKRTVCGLSESLNT